MSANGIKITNIESPIKEDSRSVLVDPDGKLIAVPLNEANKLGNSSNYKVYTALLTQTGTNAPSAEVGENTVGAVIWTRSISGQYTGTLTGAFLKTKTYMFGQSPYVQINRSTDDSIIVKSGVEGAFEDDMLDATPIEIRVYN